MIQVDLILGRASVDLCDKYQDMRYFQIPLQQDSISESQKKRKNKSVWRHKKKNHHRHQDNERTAMIIANINFLDNFLVQQGAFDISVFSIVCSIVVQKRILLDQEEVTAIDDENNKTMFVVHRWRHFSSFFFSSCCFCVPFL